MDGTPAISCERPAAGRAGRIATTTNDTITAGALCDEASISERNLIPSSLHRFGAWNHGTRCATHFLRERQVGATSAWSP